MTQPPMNADKRRLKTNNLSALICVYPRPICLFQQPVRAHNRTMMSGTMAGPAERSSRFLAFLLGTVLALASFAFLAWDLEHHQAPYSPQYSPQQPPSPIIAWFRYYWLVDLPVRLWLRHRRKWQAESAMR
jgi:hypothetical protein